MNRIILLVILLVTGGFTFAQNRLFENFTDSTLLRKENDLLIKDFESRVKKIDPKVDFKGLKTVVMDSLYTGYYLPKTNRIYLTPWQTTPQMILDFCTDVAGGKKEGERLSAMFFYGFFLPHEIGHALQFATNTRKDNEYDNEYAASEMALLYWKKRGKDGEMKECYEIAKKALSKLKSPIPEKEDVKKYFTEHYDEMAQDGYKYGYIMFRQIVSVFEDKNLPDFDTYIKRYLSGKSGH